MLSNTAVLVPPHLPTTRHATTEAYVPLHRCIHGLNLSFKPRIIQCLSKTADSNQGPWRNKLRQPCASRDLQPTDSPKRELTISWPGSGLYFFWQLGALKYLAEHFDLTKVAMVGASGGALAAVLAACGVPADLILLRAYELSLQHDIWSRPLALVGIWGGLVERWLDDLLPSNAHELCQGRVTVVVATLPSMKQVGISDFKDKHDLINACLASAHVPFVLDFKLSRQCRGSACVDGQLPDFFKGNCDLLTLGGDAVVFDYFDDDKIIRQGRMDMLQLKSYDEIKARMELGYEYAKRLHQGGSFAGFHLEEVMLQSNGHMQEVLVADGASLSQDANTSR